jgi:ABC-type glycerol-3-phosphate transport system substrate-binding protein
LPVVRSAQVLYYNQSWAEELFSRTAGHPGAVQEQACARHNRADDDPQNDGSGGLAISTQPTAAAGWLESFGSEFARPDGSGYRFNTSQVEEAFRFLRGLYDAGCAWLPENDSFEDDFASRRALFTAGSLADVPGQLAIMERAGNRDRWTVLPFPSPDGEPAISAYGPSYVILKTTPEQQLAAWLFARWLSEPERQAALALASGTLPTRRSAAQQLSALSSSSAQWHAGQGLIETARMEPSFASWSTVRWALGDAATQLFRYYFTADGIPSLVQLLDETAQELHERSPKE